jgi:hypothetical protein
MSAQRQATTIEKLRERIPESLISTRQQGGANIRYIEWHAAADLLDERAPGWTSEIKEVGSVAGKIFVRVAMTIEGVTRENIGYEDEKSSGYGDPFSNAYAMAFKRAAALFGLGRHLYDKDDKQQSGRQAYTPQTRTASPASQPLVESNKPPTPQQIGEIKQLRIKLKDTSPLDFSKLTYGVAEKILAELRAR